MTDLDFMTDLPLTPSFPLSQSTAKYRAGFLRAISQKVGAGSTMHSVHIEQGAC